MNKFKFFSVALLASAFASQAQDINQAKKAVDAEQFESACCYYAQIWLTAHVPNMIRTQVSAASSELQSCRINYDCDAVAVREDWSSGFSPHLSDGLPPRRHNNTEPD